MQNQRIKIEKLVYGGYGLGHIENQAVFVPYSAPGDELMVEIGAPNKGVQWGEITEIFTASPLRSQPFCPYFGKSGGCHLQHIQYSEQLKHKEDVLRDALQRIGGFENIQVSPCLPSPKQTAYRQRVTLHWRKGKHSGLGFYKPESHNLIPIDNCPLLTPELNKALSDISVFLEQNPPVDLKEIQLVQGTDKKVSLTLMMPLTPITESWANKLREKIPLAGGSINQGQGTQEKIIWGKGYVEYKVKGWKLRAANSAFFQANLDLLPTMIDYVLNAVSLSEIACGLELYSGVGLFTLPLSKRVKKLFTIEGNRQTVESALYNLKENKVNNVAAKHLDVQRGLDLLLSQKLKFDLLVLDPPREGLTDEIIARLKKIAPRQIIYISCNPTTLARDVKKLSANGEYKLGTIQPFDMFPHTFHVEAVCSLLKAT